MIATPESPDVVFTTVRGKARPVASQSFRVCFARGAVIQCASEAEIRSAIAAHLARARKYQVHDQVVTAERIVKPAL